SRHLWVFQKLFQRFLGCRRNDTTGYRNFRIADRALHIWDEIVLSRFLSAFGVAILSALILATRCANYQDVFVAGNVYFVDADCYARMTRVRMVSANPGLIVRHHVFENFPQGT